MNYGVEQSEIAALALGCVFCVCVSQEGQEHLPKPEEHLCKVRKISIEDGLLGLDTFL